jgi:hypothetical protein
MMSFCICVECKNKTEHPDSVFCDKHLQEKGKIKIALSIKSDGTGSIFGTNYLLKRVGHTYVIYRTNNGLLQAKDKTNVIRTGLMYGEVDNSDVICPECTRKSNSSSLYEFTCGHYYHRDCVPEDQKCIICLERGNPIKKKEVEIKLEDCVVCCSKVEEKPLECGHSVHRRCIARWSPKIPCCPICRTNIVLSEEHMWLMSQINAEKKREVEREDYEIAVQLQRSFGGF